MHARPIAEIARLAARFRSQITVQGPGGEADASSVLHLMTLAAPQGSVLEFRARGADAEAALQALCELVAGGFEEL